MGQGFFVTGEEADRRHAEIEERDRIHMERQTASAREIEFLLASAETDREAAQLVAMARLLSPDGWASRQTWIDMAERERTGPKANDPATAIRVQRHMNMAALSVEYPLHKARQAIELVRSWG